VLSDAGSTDRPHSGHDIPAVNGNFGDMLKRRATIVPLQHGVNAAGTGQLGTANREFFGHGWGIFTAAEFSDLFPLLR
jgi:hypothetical protein